MRLLLLLCIAVSANAFIINGEKAPKGLDAVFNYQGCTWTKVGEYQFLTAAHCTSAISGKISKIYDHPTWIKDCSNFRCTGKEVGGPNMTPGRVDIAFVTFKEKTPNIPIMKIRFKALPVGSDVAMVGFGCKGGVDRADFLTRLTTKKRIAYTKTTDHLALEHEHSLYKDIAEITAKSNIITYGHKYSRAEASLCPGDSGGPLITKNELTGEWELAGIAADYTFDHSYRDGAHSMTNLHARVDDDSLHGIGQWLRKLMSGK